jgi:hypothetical protein
MTRSINRGNRICRQCVVQTLAGLAWPMWGDRLGWPKVSRCGACDSAARRD